MNKDLQNTFHGLDSGDYYYARLDDDRYARQGFREVIYCEGKSLKHLTGIYQDMYDRYGYAFGTRATKEQAAALRQVIPSAEYDEISRILKVGKTEEDRIGNICICSAGTADIGVCEEAAQTAEYFGGNVTRIYDIGVSGINRLLSYTDAIRRANCVVVVAGMEGALASVVGGLVRVPVIAVPTSVGYGAGFEGLSALLTMINSCANGVTVVNIDNGYGAAYTATQINRLACGRLEK